MGLEIVELLMSVEDSFKFTITDEEAENIATIGQLHDLVVSKVSPPMDEAVVWNRLKHLIVSQLAIAPEAVTRETRFIDDLGLG